jgi:hypothetical protein
LLFLKDGYAVLPSIVARIASWSTCSVVIFSLC